MNCAGVIALLIGLYFATLRPWMLSWGATSSEIVMAFPSDELISNAVSQQTRAITINASKDEVWPWIAQIGQDRAGFYSFDILENAVGCEMPIENGIRTEFQLWKVGDRMWMYPPRKANGSGYGKVARYIPGQVLGLLTRSLQTSQSEPADASWTFFLRPIDKTHSRLLMRGRGMASKSLFGFLFDRCLFEPMHFVMERRMMLGIKDLAETAKRDRLSNHMLVLLWITTACSGGWYFIRYVYVGAGDRSLLGFSMAGILFPYLTLFQPSVWVGLLLVVCLIVVGPLMEASMKPMTPKG